MQKKNFLFLSAASLLLMTSCSKLGPLSADNFTVVPNPLETQAGQVPATINGTFPEKYMKKKAVVTVTPELRYADGQVAKGQSATFQGEKVMGNDQTISYKVGGRYTMKTAFDYVPEMQKSEMYLTFDARIGKKQQKVPAVKVANGVIATSELYRKTLASENGCIAPDTFQRVNEKKQEANIKFLINQANIRKSELKNNSVKEFVEMLKKINADREGFNVQNVEIQAYASPEGGVKLNDKLAGNRKNESEKYVKNTLKRTKVNADIDAHYTAQDWDGFQKLVAASNLQDKEVILRVLSMYEDPQEREQQIRNMSAGSVSSLTASSPSFVVHVSSSTMRQSVAQTSRLRHSTARTLLSSALTSFSILLHSTRLPLSRRKSTRRQQRHILTTTVLTTTSLPSLSLRAIQPRLVSMRRRLQASVPTLRRLRPTSVCSLSSTVTYRTQSVPSPSLQVLSL